MKKFTTLELKWGIIFFIAALLWMYYEKLMGWHNEKIDLHASATSLFAIPAITIYVFALIEKRKKHYNNAMTWTQGFVCALYITLVITILSPLSQYIANEWISPEYFSNAIHYSVETLGKDRVDMEACFNLRNYIIKGTTNVLGMGIVTSSIVSLFVKNK